MEDYVPDETRDEVILRLLALPDNKVSLPSHLQGLL
jgi:hypothetical protein